MHSWYRCDDELAAVLRQLDRLPALTHLSLDIDNDYLPELVGDDASPDAAGEKHAALLRALGAVAGIPWFDSAPSPALHTLALPWWLARDGFFRESTGRVSTIGPTQAHGRLRHLQLHAASASSEIGLFGHYNTRARVGRAPTTCAGSLEKP